MTFNIDQVVHDRYLFYAVHGHVTVNAMKSLADRLRDDGVAENRSCALLDCAGINGALSIGELFDVGEYFASVLPSVFKLAGVNMPAEWSNNDFSEDVISNRGGQLRHFKAIAEAEAWFAENE